MTTGNDARRYECWRHGELRYLTDDANDALAWFDAYGDDVESDTFVLDTAEQGALAIGADDPPETVYIESESGA